MPTSPHGPTPDAVMQGLSAFWASGALRAAIELNLFAAIAHGAGEAGAIAQAIGAPERSTRMLCDALAALGYLSKSEAGYALTPVAETFLDPAKATYFGGMSHIVAHDMLWHEFGRLAEVVRHGGSLMEEHALTPDHDFWQVFAQHSLPLAGANAGSVVEALESLGIPAPGRILDLACGTGAYGYTLAARYPTSQVTFVDWPKVLARTRAYAPLFSAEGRVDFRAGDIFEVDLGGGYDLVLLTNIYHHFDRGDCLRLSQRVRKALRPGGTAVVVDFIPGDDRTGHPMPILFSLVMLAWTPAGDTYTEAQYRDFLGEAGFGTFDRHPTPTPQSILVAR